jgi:hypothetical protein
MIRQGYRIGALLAAIFQWPFTGPCRPAFTRAGLFGMNRAGPTKALCWFNSLFDQDGSGNPSLLTFIHKVFPNPFITDLNGGYTEDARRMNGR